MAKILLSDRQKAKDKVKKLKVICLGHKELNSMSWEALAAEMGMSRTTLKYRFDKGLLTIDEWIVLIHILKVEREALDLWIS